MSIIEPKDPGSLELINKFYSKFENEKHENFLNKKVKVINCPERCLVCRKQKHQDSIGRIIRFVVHHIKYSPEIVSFVHEECHQKIHDPDNPLTQFIQYGEGESIKFYKGRKKNSTGVAT